MKISIWKTQPLHVTIFTQGPIVTRDKRLFLLEWAAFGTPDSSAGKRAWHFEGKSFGIVMTLDQVMPAAIWQLTNWLLDIHKALKIGLGMSWLFSKGASLQRWVGHTLDPQNLSTTFYFLQQQFSFLFFLNETDHDYQNHYLDWFYGKRGWNSPKWSWPRGPVAHSVQFIQGRSHIKKKPA